jgi:hypothetical protein
MKGELRKQRGGGGRGGGGRASCTVVMRRRTATLLLESLAPFRQLCNSSCSTTVSPD